MTNDRLRVLLVVGTRPEAIKMAPVILECRRHPRMIEPIVCFTGQHRELLAQAAADFGIAPDVDLDLMTPGQTPAQFAARALAALDELVGRSRLDGLVAQGDTTSVMAASMAAFYRRVAFVHVEAGLRSGNLWAPWPEEFHRRVAGRRRRNKEKGERRKAEGPRSGDAAVPRATVGTSDHRQMAPNPRSAIPCACLTIRRGFHKLVIWSGSAQ